MYTDADMDIKHDTNTKHFDTCGPQNLEQHQNINI